MAEVLELSVESLDHEGRGVARHEGKVVFVSGALPGERVRAQIIGRKPKFDRARVVDVLAGSSQRVRPRCPHFGLHAGACGGCSMQHLATPAQVAIKARVLEDALWHLGRIRPEMVLPPLVGPAWGYRHRARLSVRHVARKGTVLVGFHERASSYVADMRECHVLPKAVSDLLVPLRELINGLSLRERLPQIEIAVDRRNIVLVFRVLQAPTDADRARLAGFGRDHGVSIWLQPAGPASATPLDAAQAQGLALQLPEFNVAVPFGPTDFTQVNHSINEVLVGRALRLLDVQPGDRVVDFFCGLGNFTLPLATRAGQVLGIEGAPELIARARGAARINGLEQRCRFETADLFEWSAAAWTATVERLSGVDRVLVDPPREGALAVVQAFGNSAAPPPRRLVYVSCNPATLARDCAILVSQQGWRLRAAGVVNMFAHTSHVESVALLEPPIEPAPERPAC